MELTSRHIARHANWKLLYVFCICILVLPILVLLFRIPGLNVPEALASIQRSLPLYLTNTIFILVGVGSFSLLLGVPAAWFISTTQFPMSRHFEWLLILPLTLPTYINAIAYSGLTDYAGPIRTFMRNSSMMEDVYLDIMTPSGVIFVMATVLYPYVYLTSRAAFTMQSGKLIEVSRTLGLTPFRTFFKIAFPVAWPLIFSGLSLVLMEVLNDYGTVSYYGVPTFTAGIFRSWLSLGNLPGAIFLAMLLLVFVLIILFAEEFYRGRRKYAEQGTKHFSKQTVLGWKKWAIFSICLVPVVLGFIFPLIQISIWFSEVMTSFSWNDFGTITFNTLLLSFLSAVIIVVLGVLFSFSQRIIRPVSFFRYFSKSTSLGYATPGAVIGLGIIICILWLNDDWLYTGIIALIYGYCIRFFAVGNNSLESSMKKIDDHLDDAAISMGASRFHILRKILLPLIRPGILVAFIMVFVDVSKELPLTLILRPFNYETLATNAFQYAKDELAAQSAPASLLIIILGSISVYLLNRTFRIAR